MSLPIINPIPVPADPSVHTMTYVPTDLPLHPNTLITMVTAHIGMTQILGTSRSNPKAPLLGGSLERFVPVLDAFASLAVSNPDTQVVAIAAQHENNSTVLTVAENAALTPGLAEHLTALVGILKKLSTDPNGRATHERALHMAAYLHSGRKIAKRYQKHLAWLQGFEETFIHGNEEHVPKLRLVLSALLTVYEALEPALPALKINSVWGVKTKVDVVMDDSLWDTALDLMKHSMDEARILIGMPELCERWAVGLQGTHGVIYRGAPIAAPLHRTIEKLTSHHRHITNLITYALSPAGTSDLSKVFLVQAKKANQYAPSTALPNDALIKQMVYTCLNSTDAVQFDMECARMTTTLEKAFKYVATDTKLPTVASTVHCECALIQSFCGDPPPSEWPLAYIGVSKLSCAACHAWIQAFNNVNPRKFETMGSHGRWYPGWAMPQNSPPLISAAIKSVVGKAYLRWYRAGSKIEDIVLSDSSQADGCQGPVLSFQDRLWVARVGQEMGESPIDARKVKAAAAAAGTV